MSESLWLIPAFPYAAFLTLSLAGSRFNKRTIAVIGCGAVAVPMVLAVVELASLAVDPSSPRSQLLSSWITSGGLDASFGLYFDALAAVMVLVVTVVGFLIFLYSTRFMADDESYRRFFAYMSLFVGSMLVLVMADNLVLLYLGWEAVGLCSYLLIGFWYRDPANGRAARKAFIVTRVGDAALALGLFLLFDRLGTLDIQDLLARASSTWSSGTTVASAAAALLLIGAMGKSAQVPLQTWLPDAMAGPTPVSALIHAATMVTAGVYLIARTHVLFELAPTVEAIVAIVGAVTLVLAGFAALAQRDIKRILAYSTISQIGYMFLALGVGAWTAALFHFVTHAFFKALLFLGAGVVIASLDDQHDIFEMGGLRQRLPVTFWTFLIGAASLAALPLVTGGFYSKDLILWKAWSSPAGGPWLWLAGLVGALLTSLYAFRMVFVAFFGELKSPFQSKESLPIAIPLITLAAFAVLSGFVEVPPTLARVDLFSSFLGAALPTAQGTAPERVEGILQGIAAAVSLGGIAVAYFAYLRAPRVVDRIVDTPIGNGVRALWNAGWGFDWIYDHVFVRPYGALARWNQSDIIDRAPDAIAKILERTYWILRRTQSGKLRWYTAGIVIGAISSILLLVLR